MNAVHDQFSMRMLREALEGVLSPDLATSLLFDALEPFGSRIPEGTDALLALARGPLHDAIVKRVGEGEASAVLERVEELIARSKLSQANQPPPDPFLNEDRLATTTRMPILREAMTVLIVAAGQGLSLRLEAALGSDTVLTYVISSPQNIRNKLRSADAPYMALVDATDFAQIDAALLADIFADGAPTLVRAIWGAELPYGRAIATAMTQRGFPPLELKRADGVESLLDLIRSRRLR